MTITQGAGIAAGRWTIDTARSAARVTVSNFGFKRVTGTVPITDASVVVDTDGLPGAVRAELNLAAIDTGNQRRERDLAKPHLLNTARYPTMSFEGTGTVQRVTGTLTVRGVAVPLDLAVTVSQSPDGTVTVHATTGFDRSPLGMKAPRLMIGGWIEVAISAVFGRVG